MSPRPTDDDRHLGDVPIRLYRFRARTRPRWAARIDLPDLGTPEAYGATPDEALRSLATALTTGDLERLRLHTEPSAASPEHLALAALAVAAMRAPDQDGIYPDCSPRCDVRGGAIHAPECPHADG